MLSNHVTFMPHVREMGGVFSLGVSENVTLEDDHKSCEFQVFRLYADKIIDEQKIEILSLRHRLAEVSKENVLLKRRVKKLL